MASPFEVLGLSDDATVAEITARWRELAAAHHPDRGGAGVEFARYRAAYVGAKEIASMPVKCPDCYGTGKARVTRGFATTFLHCNTCGGKGEVLRC